MSWRGPTWLRHTGLPVARLPGVLPPTTWRGKQQLKSRLPGFPVARVSPASREFPPGRSSALAVNEFVLRLGERAQGFPASNFKIFLVIREIHKKARVIPRERRLSTTLSTAWSTGRSLGRLARNEGRIGQDPGARCEHPAVRCRSGDGGIWEGMPYTQRGPSTYEVEGPRRGHSAGLPITRLPGVLYGRSTGAGKSARSASFPALHAPAQTFRFPGPPECGGPADLHIWWCGISTACRRAAQGLLARNLRILSL
jgi:hypothetical protein